MTESDCLFLSGTEAAKMKLKLAAWIHRDSHVLSSLPNSFPVMQQLYSDSTLASPQYAKAWLRYGDWAYRAGQKALSVQRDVSCRFFYIFFIFFPGLPINQIVADCLFGGTSPHQFWDFVSSLGVKCTQVEFCFVFQGFDSHCCYCQTSFSNLRS